MTDSEKFKHVVPVLIKHVFQLYYMSGGELNMADYQSYGCHCASGAGHGAPVDDIDSSCQRNNQCRSCTQIDWSSCQAQQAYFVNGWAPNNVDGIICGQ